MKATWLLGGLMALALVSIPSQSYARDNDRKDMDTQTLKFDDLPGPVKQAIGAEKGSSNVDDVVKVTRDGRTYYKARIDNGKTERLLVVSPEGKIISHWNVTEEGKKKTTFDQLPGEVKAAIGKQVGENHVKHISQITRDGHTYYWVRTDTHGTMVVDEQGRISDDLQSAEHKMDRRGQLWPSDIPGLLYSAQLRDRDRDLDRNRDRNGRDYRSREMQLNDLPRAVRDTLDRHRDRDSQIQEITRVDRDNRTYYKVRLDERNASDRVLVIEQDGTLTRNWSAGNALGQRQDLRFDDLPGEVKSALGKEYGGNKIDRVYQYRQDGDTYYRAHVEGQGWVLVDSRGRFVDEDQGYPGGNQVEFDRLPGPVKQAIGSEIGSNKVSRVYERRMGNGGVRYYAESNDGRSITVDGSGKIINEGRGRRD